VGRVKISRGIFKRKRTKSGIIHHGAQRESSDEF
jgi:hypothetical protein